MTTMVKPPPLLAILALFLGLQGCASIPATAWELRREESPLPVRAAASLGDTVGFVAAVPLSVALMPVTVPLVHIFDVGDPYALLFLPSLKVGELLSVLTGGAVDLSLRPFRSRKEP